MNGPDRILAILREALSRADEGLLLEVLEREIAKILGRPISRKNLEDILVRHPYHFDLGPGGRWRIKVQREEVEPEDVGPTSRAPLTRGGFIIFDLETLGKEA